MSFKLPDHQDRQAAAAAARIDPNLERNSVTLVASADRSFTRDTRNVKLFAAYDPGNKTTFARFIGAVSLGGIALGGGGHDGNLWNGDR